MSLRNYKEALTIFDHILSIDKADIDALTKKG